MRERWAALQNQVLERQGHEARVDHRSLEAQRAAALAQGREQQAEELDRAAEIKLGLVVSAIERREQHAAEREERAYEPLTERGAQVHQARQARGLLAELAGELVQARERLAQELRERAELARQAYTREMEEGTSRISAGLAALRAAAQRHGVGHEGQGQQRRPGYREEDASQRRHREQGRGPTTGLDSIREQLARIRGQGVEREAGRDEAEAAQVPTVGQGLRPCASN